jgi:Flp pilus assembly protein TadG
MPSARSLAPSLSGSRLARDKRGVTAVEFAFVGMIFIMLMLGTVEISRYYVTAQSLRTLTAEAARAGLLQVNANFYNNVGSPCSVSLSAATKAALLQRVPLLQLSNVSTTQADWVLADCSAPKRVTANLSYTFTFLVRFLPSGTITLNERTALSFP